MFDTLFEKGTVRRKNISEGCKKESCGTKKEACGTKRESCGTKKEACGTKKESCKNEGCKKEQGYCNYCKSNPCKCEIETENLMRAVSKKASGYMNGIQKKLDKRKALREALVSEVLKKILNESLGLQAINTTEYNLMKENLVVSFVKEKGAENLLETFKGTSVPLCEASLLCEDYQDKILLFVDEADDSECIVDSDEKKNFYNDLNKIDFSSISTAIKARVMGAISSYQQSNINLKSDLTEETQKAEEKITGAKTESVKESIEMKTKAKLNSIKKNKKKNILECMVYNISKAALLNENMSSYRDENGKLDMFKINENAKVMYTFLEMLNTTKLEKIDESYIRDVLKSLE